MEQETMYLPFSERIIYSLPEEKDINDIYNNISYSIVKNIGGNAPWHYQIEDARNFVEDSKQKVIDKLRYDYILRARTDYTFLGIAALHITIYEECEKPGQIGYWITKNKQRKGYASEASEAMVALGSSVKNEAFCRHFYKKLYKSRIIEGY